MAKPIEWEIQDLLMTMGDPPLVADEMLKKWHRDELTEEELERVAHFLFTFGFHTALAENLALKIKDNFQVPWSAVGRLLATLTTPPPKEIIDVILIGATEQKGLEALVRNDIDSLDPRFSKVRAQTSLERNERIKNLKESLLSQAELFRNDRRSDKEAEVIQRLLLIFPDDSEIKELYAENSARDAREKIQKGGSWATRAEAYSRQSNNLEPELQEKVAEVLEFYLKKAKENPKSAEDLALSMAQMGQTQEALNILELAPPTESQDWLKLELLLDTHRYVDALTHLTFLESKYASDPDVIPASLYGRARALWGLHQYQGAIHILENLVRVKSDYRAAESLLHNWKETIE